MKPAIMELGGHAPVIVCDDVDPVASAATSVIGKSRNAGQVACHRRVSSCRRRSYDCFAAAFAAKAREVKVGDGLDPANQMGPLANHRRIETMEAMVADAIAKGARSSGRAKPHRKPRYFYPLTVLADVPDDARAMREEPFGPLALINPVGSLDEAIREGGTRCLMASRLTLSRAQPATPIAWRKVSKPAISPSTTSWPRLPRRRSAASRKAANGREGRHRGT